MATCPNKNLDSWKSLVASRGDMAYYLWDKYEGNVPQDEYVLPVKQDSVFFQLGAEKVMTNSAIIESISQKLSSFNTYFRGTDSDDIIRQKFVELGLTQFEIDYLEALDKKSDKPKLNFSVLLANEYSRQLQDNLLEGRLAKLKMMEANKELDNQLLDFLKPLGITLKEVDDIKQRFGTDAFGVADILNRVIYAVKNRKLDTIAEELGHFYVEMMGTKGTDTMGTQLMKRIENWSGYAQVYAAYKSKYLNSKGEPNIEKIKKEAIAQAIAEAIIKRYVSQSEAVPRDERDFWKLIVDLIKRISSFFENSPNFKPLEVITDEIARKVLNKDYSDILNRIQAVKERNKERKTYEGTLEKLPFVRSVIDKIISLGGVLTGSLAIRAQGNLFRDILEKIHDLDFSVSYRNHKGDWEGFLDRVKKEFPNYYPLSEKPFSGNSGELIINGIITDYPELYEKFKSLSGDFNSRLDQFSLEDQEKMLLIDLFLNPEGYEVPQISGLQRADTIFIAKSNMGMRPKDVFDLLNYEPYESPAQLSEYSYTQLEEMPGSRASEETLNKVKEVAKKMGIDIQALTAYAKANPEIDLKSVNGVADLVRGVIAIAEGREDVSLTEEMVHIATAILEQTNPKLVTEMISKIDRFNIYKQVLEAYKGRKEYQLPNGKPDIRKIKKEAVDKLIAELIINESEGSTEFPELMQETNKSMVRKWWNYILDRIKGMYRSTNISIFETAAATIFKGEVGGTITDIKSDGLFFQLTDAQKSTIEIIKATANNIEKFEEKKEADPLLLDSEEANNGYRIKEADGTYTQIVKRVTDRVKAWYKQRFGDKEFTEAEKKFNNLKRDYGIKYHGYFEEIHDRYFNEDGSKRTAPKPRPSISDIVDSEVYDKIEKYYTELIGLLPEGTAVLSEVIIYDPKQREAGTIDFLAIDKNGKAHILDWKFMYVADDPKINDVAWFKQGAYNIQLGRYKQILKENYGIKEFGMIRAIPFLMRFQRENPKDFKSPMILRGIVAGSADKTKIDNLKLMPVSEETESTGYEQLDKLIKKLNALLKQFGSQKVTDETEREFKIERLNTIRRAIRIVQGSQNIAPLIDVIEVIRKDGERIIEDYNVTFKDRPATRQDSTDKELSEFSDDMRNYLEASEMFTNISTYIGNLLFTKDMLLEAKTKEEREYALQMQEVRTKLIEEQELIQQLRLEIRDNANNFADKHIGERNLVGGLTKPEAVVQGLSSLFRGVSELPMASLRVLYKLVSLSKGKAQSEALGEVEELMRIRDKIAKSGRDLRSTVRQIYQSDTKGGLVNKLIYKYKREFFDIIAQKKEEGGDKKWLMENIDIEAYKKEAKAKMDENIEKIRKRRYPGTKEEEQETRDDLILQERKRWDIDRKDFNGWDNYILKRHPKDVWLSEDYKKIQSDPELLELYNFITNFNQKAKDVGYIENRLASIFLPFVRKGMAESLVWDGTLSAVQNFSNNLQLRADDVGFGKFNEITGELENSIPKYYTTDFTKKGDGVNDYSDVSEDLFKNMILYIQHVNKYKYMSEVEGQLKLVKVIEEFKGHLNTDRVGNVIKGDIITSNEENTKTFEVFLRALLYEQKYALSDADTPLFFSKVLGAVKKLVNKVAGKEVWKEDENPSATSLIKTMDAANRAFQLKTLGLEIISGAVNAFGANIQMSTQAGKYFKSREFLKNEIKLSGMRFSEEERQIFTQSVDLFMPMKDDPSYEIFKKAGMSIATRGSASDFLMFFMRYPEQLVEKAVFETLMENMMVENGKIVSIHDFVKNKYKGRTKEAGTYRDTKDKIEAEVNELKEKRSIAKTRKLENGELVIPGLDLTNREELQRLTNLTRSISRNATGGLADGDVNKMSMSIWTKSMMIFRNWIPKLADTRFSEFRKVGDDFSVTVNEDGEMEGERYDVGRLRLLAHVFMNSLSKASGGVTDILSMNEKGVAAIDQLYEEYAIQYEKQTGQKMTMDRDEFADMIRTNLRNQIKELIILGTLIGTAFSLGFFEPDDEDDRSTKNAFRYTQRVVDRFVSELSFFYNPVNFEQLLSGSAFPSIGLIADFYKVMTNFFMEITGFDLKDPSKTSEEVREDAMPVKRVVKMIPAGKSILTWMSMISPEFAKEYDITIQKETNIR